jgi:hypothetical protein
MLDDRSGNKPEPRVNNTSITSQSHNSTSERVNVHYYSVTTSNDKVLKRTADGQELFWIPANEAEEGDTNPLRPLTFYSVAMFLSSSAMSC